MPLTRIKPAVYDIGAPATADAEIGWKVRANMGGKIRIKVERAVQDQGEATGNMTFSVQVAPATAGQPGTFVATTAGANLEAITNEVVGMGQSKSYEILIRPNVDRFVLFKASGGCRAQVIVEHDDIMDLWQTDDGKTTLVHV